MGQQADFEQEISLKDIILNVIKWGRYLTSKWHIILVGAFIGIVGGFTYSYSKKPTYTAELTFVLESDKGSGGGGLGSLASQFGIDIGGGGGGVFEGENLLQLMKSKSIIQKTLLTTLQINGQITTLAELYIKVYNLRNDTGKMISGGKTIKFLPKDDPSTFSVEKNNLMNGLYGSIISKNLSVDRKDKKNSIISVIVTSENELFSQHFTNLLVKNVSDFYIETKTKRAAENLAILQYRTDSVNRAFDNALTGVASSIDHNPNPNPNRQSLQVSSKSKQADAAINQAVLTQLIQNLEMAKITLRRETPLIQIIDTPSLPLPKYELSKVKSSIIGAVIGSIIAILMIVALKLLRAILDS